MKCMLWYVDYANVMIYVSIYWMRGNLGYVAWRWGRRTHEVSPFFEAQNTNTTSWEPIWDLKEFHIGSLGHQITKVGALSKEEECELFDQLIRNVDLFTWASSDMLIINTRVVCQRLTIGPSIRPVSQRKPKVYHEKRVTINEEVSKLVNVNFIIDV